MKTEIAAHVAKCDNCCRVKAIHLKPAGLLQPLPIPSWKWDEISMDFIVGLLRTSRGFDSIWVIVDRLTKSAHFIPIKINFQPHDYVEIYLDQVVKLHGVRKIIVSNRGSQWTTHFWEGLHKGLGVRSLAYHPQTAGRTERVNQILEDMLTTCVLSAKGSWDKWLSLAEFSYNNSYQSSIKMAPFEALYGRKCRTLLNWVESRERPIMTLIW